MVNEGLRLRFDCVQGVQGVQDVQGVKGVQDVHGILDARPL
jgi:hypothetical protein